jgi:predicted restriction endonuclease
MWIQFKMKKKVQTREEILSKWVRDSTKVKKLKKTYSNCCQICGEQLTLIDGLVYSEVHHIQPFNKEHKGIDDHPNMLVLCPNHHKLFDLGIIALDPEDHKILLHINPNNKLNKTRLKLSEHKLSSTYVRYHFENIFLELNRRLL